MLGIFLVIAGVVLAAYLVIKRYYAPWALLMVGILLLICVTLISGDPLVTGKKARTARSLTSFRFSQTCCRAVPPASA